MGTINTLYILIMLWGGTTTQSGIAVVQQEFYSFEACETARKTLEKAHYTSYGMNLRAQGCFKKL